MREQLKQGGHLLVKRNNRENNKIKANMLPALHFCSAGRHLVHEALNIWERITKLFDRCTHCRWASARGKSAPISSAPCAVRRPMLEQMAAWGGGRQDAWRWQEWCLVSSRPDTRRRCERPTGGSAWLPAPCSAEAAVRVQWLQVEEDAVQPVLLLLSTFSKPCHNKISCCTLVTGYIFRPWLCPPQLTCCLKKIYY